MGYVQGMQGAAWGKLHRGEGKGAGVDNEFTTLPLTDQCLRSMIVLLYQAVGQDLPLRAKFNTALCRQGTAAPVSATL